MRAPRLLLVVLACAPLIACAPTLHGELPPVVCAVPCPPPDSGPHWGGDCADALAACVAMHEECRMWVMTHFEAGGR